MKIKMDLKQKESIKLIRNVLAEEPANNTDPVRGEEDRDNPEAPETTTESTTNTGDEQNKPGEEGTKVEPKPTIDFEELIAEARKQEKEKLYPEINKQKELVAQKTERTNELLIQVKEKDTKIAELEAQISELSKKENQDESETVANLKVVIAGLENQLEEKDREVEEIELNHYRDMKLLEAGETVIPELVGGNTKEEIDLSVEKSKNRLTELTQNIMGAQPQITQMPSATPRVGVEVNAPTLDEIDLSTPEGRKSYENIRKQLGF